MRWKRELVATVVILAFSTEAMGAVLCVPRIGVGTIRLRAACKVSEVQVDATSILGPSVLEVDCTGGDTVQAAVDRAKPGDTIAISGLCHEHVTIPATKSLITLTTQASGSGIAGTVANQNVVTVFQATGLTFSNLLIQGLGVGGGSGTDPGGDGITLFDGASATIQNCVLENHRASGVSANASAVVLNNNTIRNNNLANLPSKGGVDIIFGATAKFFSNQITSNTRFGVILRAAAHAFFGSGTITGTTGAGLGIHEVSLVNAEAGTLSITDNTGTGIDCGVESRFVGSFVGSGNGGGNGSCASAS